jgi:hypothetical protein
LVNKYGSVLTAEWSQMLPLLDELRLAIERTTSLTPRRLMALSDMLVRYYCVA